MIAMLIAVAGTAWVTERDARHAQKGTASVARTESRSVTQVSGESAPTGGTAGVIEAADLKSKGDACRSARKGLRWYRGWYTYWTRKMTTGFTDVVIRSTGCPRYLARVFRAKAYRARVRYEAWWEYHYAWWDWLPLNWQDLGACETGYGRRPGNFEHTNSRFTSAFGISWAEYNADAAYFGSPPWHVRHTPRDQYNAARGHLARFGDGWTCPGP